MPHQHGSEYQVRIVHRDETEELSPWMNGEEQIAETIAALHKQPGKAYWLRQRNVLCPTCRESPQGVVEFPLADIPCPRSSPQDSRYMVAAGKRNY